MPPPNINKFVRSTKNQPNISKFFATKIESKSKGTRKDGSSSLTVNDDGENRQWSSSSGHKRQAPAPATDNKKQRTEATQCGTNNVTAHSSRDICPSTSNKLQFFAYDETTRQDADRKERAATELGNLNAASSKTRVPNTAVASGSTDRDQCTQASTHSKAGKTNASKLTPLEQQVVAIKEKYPDALLLVECGYKYRFFGEDAEIAARELNIIAHPDHNFMTASIPVHRLFVHVGVVKQTETAALKAAGENRNTPFTRELTALYTKSTLLGEDVDTGEGDEVEQSVGGHLMCLYEDVKASKPHYIAMVSVHPSTGDVVYDYFEDNTLREELETRISHLQPVEILLPQTLSEKTEKLISHVTAISTTDSDRIRVERHKNEDFVYDNAILGLNSFLNGTADATAAASDKSIAFIKTLPRHVQCCFHVLWVHLTNFHLSKLLKFTSQLQQYSGTEQHLLLSGKTQQHLEMFRNLSNHTAKGSLVWVMDHCKTVPGKRLLRRWLAQPLVSARLINQRLDAVTELINPSAAVLLSMIEVLPSLPDLEKGLASIFHQKCSPFDFYKLCESLHRVYNIVEIYKTTLTSQLTSVLLHDLLCDLQVCLKDSEKWLKAINPEGAKENSKADIFTSLADFPAVQQCKDNIASVLDAIQQHRREVRLTLKCPGLEYATVAGTQFLVEVKNSLLSTVPSDWLKINSTKTVSRFHTPFILESIRKLSQNQEQLEIEANKAWILFLQKFDEVYPYFKKATRLISEFDCLVSLAKVASFEGYCRPNISDDAVTMSIKQGRHPVIEKLLGKDEQYVPNDAEMQGDGERAMIITGPNMGGKSSYIKQVVLICVLAHVGSYVPAEDSTIPLLHSIHTRMGARDELFQGRSTFMVELEETSHILQQATNRSLVVLDELGRGTATHDGMAIAYATLRHLLTKVKCLTLFVTHYPLLAELEQLLPGNVANYHMAFLASDDDEEEEDVTFLYNLQRGVASHSFGLNVARLAGLPAAVIETASHKSHELQCLTDNRLHLRRFFEKVLNANEENVGQLLDSICTNPSTSV